MSKTLRQSLAIFLMLWLPIFSGSALAMVSCPHMMTHDMTMSAAEHADHSNAQSQQQENSLSCDQCSLCQVACSPGLTASLNPSITAASSVENATPLSLFRSITLPLLDPPPLVLV
ncbi:MAG: DUF2946 family protein [Burkholderiales bacterium]|nr:DUF2946 family protein [Burkholderiales bacterium]